MFSNDRGTFAQHYADRMKQDKQESRTDQELRGREMAADPMLQYFREKDKQAGDDAPAKTYRDSPNRYNIKPGPKWDGVNRSNGYEKKLMEREAQAAAREEGLYRMQTRDL